MLPKLSVAGDLSYSSSRQTVPHARPCDSKTTDAAVPTASQYDHLGEPHAVSLVRAVNRAHHCTSVASAAAEAAAASQSVTRPSGAGAASEQRRQDQRAKNNRLHHCRPRHTSRLALCRRLSPSRLGQSLLLTTVVYRERIRISVSLSVVDLWWPLFTRSMRTRSS